MFYNCDVDPGFVAHDFEMVGTGVWLVEDELNTPKGVYSINATAYVFSKYPKACSLKNPAGIGDHETQLILIFIKAE